MCVVVNRPMSHAVAALVAFGLACGSPSTAAASAPNKAAARAPTSVAQLAPAKELVVRTQSGHKLAVMVFPSVSWSPDTGMARGTQDRLAIAGMGTEVVVLAVAPDTAQADIAPTVDMLRRLGMAVVAYAPVSLNVNEARPRVNPKVLERNALHAMITWTKASADVPVSLFGLGKGAELALRVGATRTADVSSIVAHGASTRALKASSARLGRAGNGFEGVLVITDAGDSRRKGGEEEVQEEEVQAVAT